MKPPEQTVSPAVIGWMPVHGAILRAAARFRATGRRLVLLNESRVIERLFELAGVDDEVEFVSRSGALRALAPA